MDPVGWTETIGDPMRGGRGVILHKVIALYNSFTENDD